MPSSRLTLPVAVALLLVATARHGFAQQDAHGFAVERLNPVAPGSSWLVMDDLALDGKLGGAVSLYGGYARNPLRVTSANGQQRLNVVSDQAFADVGMAILYQRFRFYLDITNPLLVKGKSGVVDGYGYAAPDVDVGKYPDKVLDIRFGVDARLLGNASGPWRLGLSAQLFVPSGERATYVTDGTYRSLLRLLFAGSPGVFDYAGYLGVHLRPRDESPTPGTLRGSELVFGIAAGPRLDVGRGGKTKFSLGPELFGATALSPMFGSNATALEALLSARLEHNNENGSTTRFKLGVGDGIQREFGTPDWRGVIALELSDRVR